MNQVLVFQPSVCQTIAHEACGAYPNECCGFLLGRESDRERIFTDILPVSNSQPGDQRRRFAISSTDYIKAERHALSIGKDLIGVYHTHPNHPAVPSSHDLQVALPFFSYLIVSVHAHGWDHARSWQLGEDGQFFEETIQSPISWPI